MGSYDSQAFHSEPLLLLNREAGLHNHRQWIPAIHQTSLAERDYKKYECAVAQVSAWHGHAGRGPAYLYTDRVRQLSPDSQKVLQNGAPIAVAEEAGKRAAEGLYCPPQKHWGCRAPDLFK